MKNELFIGMVMNNSFYIKHKIAHPEQGNFFIYKGDTQLGYLTWTIEEVGILELRDLMITKKDHRQKGLGSMLIKALIDHAASINISEITGITQEDDLPVHDFYEKHGFYFPEAGRFVKKL